MSTNIRFEVHTESPIQSQRHVNILLVEETHQVSHMNDTDALFAILSMSRLLRDRIERPDSIIEQIIIQNSIDEQPELQRDENRKVCVTQQMYGKSGSNFTDCSVCCESYKTDDTLVSVLDCGHVFHPKCIIEWGHYNPVCPVCKKPIKIIT